MADIIGTDGDDPLDGSNGDDLLQGLVGDDTLRGLGGADTLEAGDGDDIVFGGSGDDALFGGEGYNSLSGGSGDDTLMGGSGKDTLYGGSGRDMASYENALAGVRLSLYDDAALYGAAAGDRLRDIEDLRGSAFADTFTGTDGAERLEGLGGDDTFSVGLGDDTVDGGDGRDTVRLYVSGSDVDVTVNLTLDTAQDTGIGLKTLSGIESVASGSGDDRLTGNADDNLLDSGEGDDRLTGNAGNDTLVAGDGYDLLVDARAGDDVFIGGRGADTISSGAGADRFLYAGVDETSRSRVQQDQIRGFDEDDVIDLSAIDANRYVTGDQAFVFGNGRAAGTLAVAYNAVTDKTTINFADANSQSGRGAIVLLGQHDLTADDFIL